MGSKYAFLSYLIPEQMEQEVFHNSKNNMQAAANALEWHIYNGLCRNLNCEIKIINFLPISNFPQYYKKPYIKTSSFKTDSCNENINLGFCNLVLIRRTSQFYRLVHELEKWLKVDAEEKTLFIYTASDIFLKAVEKLKTKYEFKTCVIIADLPNMAVLNSGLSNIKKLYVNRIASKTDKYLKNIDCFVLLTEHMATYLGISQPYCVMEGIATTNSLIQNIPSKNEKTVLYSGLLHKKFGILNLLEAFHSIKDDTYRLVLCGQGDAEQEILEMCKKDTRISFMGQLPRNEVLQLQQQATLLVNPRQNNEEFTRYSFPSKNLEYLSAGRPLVAYKLDGIPDEYDEYIFYVEDDSIQTLSNKIVEICSMDNNVLFEHCRKTQQFVFENKNELAQTKKIIELIGYID